MKPLVLCILDGVGIRNEEKGNAFKQANKPNFDFLWNNYPHSLLHASGPLVGLPEGQMGTSEVGHMNIGAGRIVYQPLQLINEKIKDKSFFENKNILEVINHTKDNKSKLHILGLISDGGIHSHIDHLMAILDMCKKENITNLHLHLFTDGRDVSPYSAYSFIEKVENKLKEIGIGTISTIGGRYYGMDRDNNYDRLKKGYDAIVHGIGNKSNSIKDYINESYQNNITDEFLEPAIFDENGLISENDGIIVFNFRKDRLREILTSLTNPDFNDMAVKKFHNLKVVTMLPVVESVKANYAYNDTSLKNILGEYLEKCGLSQLRIAETEKYAHVTFFFDGGKEINYENETKIIIPSPKVATYDLKPEMSAYLITDKLLEIIASYDVVILNYANGDMVGHTGNIEAAKKAVEVLDECLGKLIKKVEELDGTLIVTADHGNCDYMLDEFDNVVTSHSTSLVPFIVNRKDIKLENGKLGDIAPTMLSLLDLEIPEEMTGNSLIKR